MSIPHDTDRDSARGTLIQAVVTEMRGLSTAMDRLDQVAAQRFGLNRTDQRSLDVISQADALSPAELAQAVGISTSAATTVIDRLERAGYVTRTPDAHDRRRSVLQATARTQQVADELFGPIVAATIAHAQRYRAGELAAIADFLAHHREIIETRLRLGRPPSPGPDSRA
jgi:DNA-binding MarR family transcriptional regulator